MYVLGQVSIETLWCVLLITSHSHYEHVFYRNMITFADAMPSSTAPAPCPSGGDDLGGGPGGGGDGGECLDLPSASAIIQQQQSQIQALLQQQQQLQLQAQAGTLLAPTNSLLGPAIQVQACRGCGDVQTSHCLHYELTSAELYSREVPWQKLACKIILRDILRIYFLGSSPWPTPVDNASVAPLIILLFPPDNAAVPPLIMVLFPH